MKRIEELKKAQEVRMKKNIQESLIVLLDYLHRDKNNQELNEIKKGIKEKTEKMTLSELVVFFSNMKNKISKDEEALLKRMEKMKSDASTMTIFEKISQK